MVSPRSISNRRMKDRKRRKALRGKLRKEGLDERIIDQIIDQQRWDDLVARVGLERAQIIQNAKAHKDDPDDTGYQPSAGDPLLRGAGRVDGVTAKVVRRESTITKFQYDRLVDGGGS